MSLDYFPTGWLKTTVGNIAEVIAGGTPKASDLNNFAEAGDGVAWITPADLSRHNCKYITHGARDLSQTGYNNSSAKLMPAGTLLFSSRAPIGYVAIASCPISTNQGFKNFVFYSEIDPSYSYYYLRSIREVAESLGTGTTFKEISGTTAKTLPFVLPPLAEQREIADRLDTLLAQVDTLKGRLDALPAILKRFRQSVLAAAVSGKLTEEWREKHRCSSAQDYIFIVQSERNELKSKKLLKKSAGPIKEAAPIIVDLPNTWCWVHFDHIAAHNNNALKAGPFGSALKKSDCVDSGYKVYGQEQVIASNEALTTYYIDEDKYAQLASCAVHAGDILISLVGTIGKVLILSEKSKPGIINPRLVKLSLQDSINKKYIKYYLDSPIAHGFFKTFSHGGTMEILNLKILKELPIPFPPLEEQTEIVRRVEQLFAFADQVEQRVKEAQGRVNNLTQSILAKAFRGELTAEWREQHPELISGENSASVLLARIQAERAAQAPIKRTRKKKASA